MSRIFEAVYQLPAPYQWCANGTAITAALAAFFEKIQGPMAGLAAALSVLWLGLQIFGWVRNEIRAWRKR